MYVAPIFKSCKYSIYSLIYSIGVYSTTVSLRVDWWTHCDLNNLEQNTNKVQLRCSTQSNHLFIHINVVIIIIIIKIVSPLSAPFIHSFAQANTIPINHSYTETTQHLFLNSIFIVTFIEFMKAFVLHTHTQCTVHTSTKFIKHIVACDDTHSVQNLCAKRFARQTYCTPVTRNTYVFQFSRILLLSSLAYFTGTVLKCAIYGLFFWFSLFKFLGNFPGR